VNRPDLPGGQVGAVQIFRSRDDTVDRCCDAWNKLVDQPWRIMTIGRREWAPSVLISGRWDDKCCAS